MPPVSRHPAHAKARLQAWFAIAILLLGMLAPSISVALSHARGDSSWQDICRSSASAGVRSDAQQQGEALKMLVNGHCAMCHLQAFDLLAPPPVEPVLHLQGQLAHAMPERFYSAPRSVHAWRAAPARAPPLTV